MNRAAIGGVVVMSVTGRKAHMSGRTVATEEDEGAGRSITIGVNPARRTLRMIVVYGSVEATMTDAVHAVRVFDGRLTQIVPVLRRGMCLLPRHGTLTA